MKTASLLLVLTIITQAPTALSQLLNPITAPINPSSNQKPLDKPPNIVMPVLPPSANDDSPSEGTSDVIISDVISRERIINIFAGFTRDIDNISKRLEDNGVNTTVLAPLNSEIQKLPRKPWEDPKDYEELGANAYGGSDGESRAHRNLRRFVEAHVVPVSPWKEGEKVETVGGGKLWWDSKDGKKTVSVKRRRDYVLVMADHWGLRSSLAISRYRVLPIRCQMGRSGSSRGSSTTNHNGKFEMVLASNRPGVSGAQEPWNLGQMEIDGFRGPRRTTV